MGKQKSKIPRDIRNLLHDVADQLRTDNTLFKILKKYVEEQSEDLATFVQLNIELTEDKWARVLEELEESS